MATYAALCVNPKIFPALTGLTREEFDRLAIELAAALDRTRAT